MCVWETYLLQAQEAQFLMAAIQENCYRLKPCTMPHKPCTKTYNIMISCFGEQQRWKDEKGLFGRMQSQGLLPNVGAAEVPMHISESKVELETWINLKTS
nr:pentatricopeptide repeat-containing protein, mitochondrial [Quercus suber]